MKDFGQLFKRYRLLAGFASLSEFTDAFANKGYIYDVTLFSHWQKGKRLPSKRFIFLALIELFIEHGAIHSINEANEFLESAGHGYLTKREQERLQIIKQHRLLAL